MTYHANHSWCINCNWNDKDFDSETMVYFERTITKPDILENNENISHINKMINPDFTNILEEKLFFDKKRYDEKLSDKLEIKEFRIGRKLTNLEKEKYEKEFMNKDDFFNLSYTLKQNVLEWLNENVKDVLNLENQKLDINESKAWAIGNNEYISRNDHFTIFFKRELDALKFIREFSIFKEPIFYFDYFSEDRRNMDLNKYIYLYNEYATNNNIELIDVSKVSLDNLYQGNINLDTLSFTLLDWEKTEIDEETGEIYKADDIELTEEELEEYVKSLYKTTNEDISYEKHNLTNFPEYIRGLTKTDEISLYYDIEEEQNEIDI